MPRINSINSFNKFLKNLDTGESLYYCSDSNLHVNGQNYPRYINEFWTSKQRQASSVHEVSYRACFKPQLPRFFIELFTDPRDLVYDPFTGRGTSIIEAGLMGRYGISNDINPLTEILCKPRLCVPLLSEVIERLDKIDYNYSLKADFDLSMFYEKRTESEIISLKEYLENRKESGKEDYIDQWIRMVATNRLTGHSVGFFSVYTLPPNQATSPERQKIINVKRDQNPEYRDTKALIIKKTKTLLRNLSDKDIKNLKDSCQNSIFLSKDARSTPEIVDESVSLTVTSPPFLDIVKYSHDNWLRCWFNSLDSENIGKKISMISNVEEWSRVMGDVFKELFRITKPGGWVAFEVGEVRNGKVCLDEYVVPLGIAAGFECAGVVINEQHFTKTSNIWGIENRKKGTNTNRIAVFQKPRSE